MKNKILRYITYAVLMVGVFTTSCDKWIDPALNIDPDSPTDVYSAMILSSAEANLGYTYQGWDYVGVTNMWLQYFVGTDRQAYGMYNYLFTSDDCANLYSNLYAGVMMDCHQVIVKTSETGKESPHLRGAAKVLTAVSLGTAAGLWGSVPYSEAFQGDGNLKPKFDAEADIYAAIQNLLDEAITDLSVAGTDYEEKYISGATQDLIYGGDWDAWIKAAYTLKARYEIRLTKKGAAYFDADNVLANLAQGIADNSEDCVFGFSDAAYSSSNPLFEFYWERYGYGWTNDNFTGMLAANSDPRLSMFENDPTDSYWSAGGYAMGYASSPGIITSFVEAKFMEAECQFIKGDLPAAATAYNEAVTASLAKWDVTDAGWLATNAAEDNTTITLQKIMEGKYIAMYSQGEAWSDFRRYDMQYPALTPPAENTTSGVMPASYPYPTDEKVSNGANVPARGTITAPLWAFE